MINKVNSNSVISLRKELYTGKKEIKLGSAIQGNESSILTAFFFFFKKAIMNAEKLLIRD